MERYRKLLVRKCSDSTGPNVFSILLKLFVWRHRRQVHMPVSIVTQWSNCSLLLVQKAYRFSHIVCIWMQSWRWRRAHDCLIIRESRDVLSTSAQSIYLFRWRGKEALLYFLFSTYAQPAKKGRWHRHRTFVKERPSTILCFSGEKFTLLHCSTMKVPRRMSWLAAWTFDYCNITVYI